MLPLTVKVNAAPPGIILAGEMEIAECTGLYPTGLIVNVAVFDVPPPGAGVTTVTAAVPAVVTREELTVAVNCVELIEVVVSADPFQLITELPMTFVPFTVRVNAGAPATRAA